jgi:hypothetical protein
MARLTGPTECWVTDASSHELATLSWIIILLDAGRVRSPGPDVFGQFRAALGAL